MTSRYLVINQSLYKHNDNRPNALISELFEIYLKYVSLPDDCYDASHKVCRRKVYNHIIDDINKHKLDTNNEESIFHNYEYPATPLTPKQLKRLFRKQQKRFTVYTGFVAFYLVERIITDYVGIEAFMVMSLIKHLNLQEESAPYILQRVYNIIEMMVADEENANGHYNIYIGNYILDTFSQIDKQYNCMSDWINRHNLQTTVNQ